MHDTCSNGDASTCKLLCALDEIDVNALTHRGESALDLAIENSKYDIVNALLELNVDTSTARVDDDDATTDEIAQLLEVHRLQPVE